MNRSLLFSLALAMMPTMSLAQAAPPLPMAADRVAPTAAQLAAMQQFHAQLQQVRQQNRARLLAALTPQHRSAVAAVVGQLALSPSPDIAGAARQVDAILSGGERQSILSIEDAHRTQMQALMQQHRASFDATLSAQDRARMVQHEAQMQASRPNEPQQDAGQIILRTLGNFGSFDGHMHGPGMHGMP